MENNVRTAERPTSDDDVVVQHEYLSVHTFGCSRSLIEMCVDMGIDPDNTTLSFA